MKINNFNRSMKDQLKKKCKLNDREWGYVRNTPEFIDVVNKSTGETRTIMKAQYNFNF